MNRELSDEQLVKIVRGLAALHLEIERGVRDPEVLAERMDPQAHHAWSRLRRAELPLPGGVARDTEIGPVHLRRSEHGRVFATVTTPTQTNRWGALTFVLDTHQGRVAIRQIQRLHARGDYGRTSARATPPNQVPLDEQIRRVRTDLDQANSALEAVTRRLDQLPSGSAQRREATTTRDSWQHVTTDLTRELAVLRDRLQARTELNPPRRTR
jgi:hypothetical protein